MKYDQDTDGTGNQVHNNSRFGVCAYPAEYGVSWTRTFIIDTGNTIFWRDTEGEPVVNWPTNLELAADWCKLD